MLIVRGTCTVDGVVFGANRAFYAPPGEAVMAVELAASTKLVVALALPTTDPVVVGGPFVMTSATEIARAYEDFSTGASTRRAGAPRPRERLGLVGRPSLLLFFSRDGDQGRGGPVCCVVLNKIFRRSSDGAGFGWGLGEDPFGPLAGWK